MNYSELPGGDLLSRGLSDLKEGRKTPEAFLLLIGAPRLRSYGIAIPNLPKPPHPREHELYDMLCLKFGKHAYQRYNSLIALLVSLENALAGIVGSKRC